MYDYVFVHVCMCVFVHVCVCYSTLPTTLNQSMIGIYLGLDAQGV